MDASSKRPFESELVSLRIPRANSFGSWSVGLKVCIKSSVKKFLNSSHNNLLYLVYVPKGLLYLPFSLV